jgi:hypothetical protein
MKGSNRNTDKVKKAPQIIELLRCSLCTSFLLSSLVFYYFFLFFFLSKLFLDFTLLIFFSQQGAHMNKLQKI